MAQPIHCDAQGFDPHLADVMVSRVADGDTTAWCFNHYVLVCQSVIDAATEAQAMADQADREAADRLEGTAPGAGEAPAAEADPPGSQEAPAATGPDDGPDRPAGDPPQEESLGSPAPDGEEAAESATA